MKIIIIKNNENWNKHTNGNESELSGFARKQAIAGTDSVRIVRVLLKSHTSLAATKQIQPKVLNA